MTKNTGKQYHFSAILIKIFYAKLLLQRLSEGIMQNNFWQYICGKLLQSN